MKIIYTHEEPPRSFSKSIFLAGPTPRSKEVKSWRPEALELLKAKGYEGVVFVPEERDGNFDRFDANYDYERTPAWEHRMMSMADIILFWIPRDLDTLPGFTTNVEFGLQAHLGKIIFGAPVEAPKNKYLEFVSKKFDIRCPAYYTLNGTINATLERIAEGALRNDGEREIPLHVWRLRSFQNWYQAQKNAGNRLDGARIDWIGRPHSEPKLTYIVALKANIYVAQENRNKINEFVIIRPDISSILVYHRNKNLTKTEIVLIKEFRSPASTLDGFIWELPSGSSNRLNDPLDNAVEEIYEEIGLRISKDRLTNHGSRQLAGTVLTHKAHLFSVEITDKELEWLKAQKGLPRGADYPKNPTGEQAYTEIMTLKELLTNGLVDWSNIGMILYVLGNSEMFDEKDFLY